MGSDPENQTSYEYARQAEKLGKNGGDPRKRYLAIILIAALVLLGLAGIWYLLSDRSDTAGDGTANANTELINAEEHDPELLERGLSFPEGTDEETQQEIQDRYDGLTQQLSDDPNNFAAWLDLALTYQTVEDNESAEQIWLFLAEAAPEQSLPFHNLGKLYHLQLQEFERSEENYRQAIEREPTQIINYIGLHELYRYSYEQDTSAAVDILEEGLEANPNHPDLLGTLGSYYAEQGDTENAVDAFTRARDAARNSGNETAASAYQEEIDRLQ